MNTCGAKTKSGGTCKNPPETGRNRCRFHGGRTPKGREHYNYRSGLYSKHAGEALSDVLEELRGADAETLIKPEEEIRLMQALLVSCKALKDAPGDLRDLDTLSKIIDRLIQAKQRGQVIMDGQRRLVPLEDVEAFLDYVEEIIHEHAEDAAGEIMTRVRRFRLSKPKDS